MITRKQAALLSEAAANTKKQNAVLEAEKAIRAAAEQGQYRCRIESEYINLVKQALQGQGFTVYEGRDAQSGAEWIDVSWG